jgi:putative selenium metabolism hydrolase
VSASDKATNPPAILDRAQELQDEMIAFLRDIVAIPSPSCAERDVVHRVRAEFEALGFDEVKIDPFGNILGRIGDGPRVLAFDSHLDTVGVGDRGQWTCDPFTGKLAHGRVYGRGAVDQKAGMAGMAYAGKIIKESGLARGVQVWMVGSVLEEDCDGLCWHYILQEGVLSPELVVSTEPTALRITRGQRGRMNIKVSATGRSCHGSMPERGDNAVAKLAPGVAAITSLNDRLATDPFLGKGSCAVTWFGCETPSLNAIPYLAELHIDRRLTQGENKESALQEVREALESGGVPAEVAVPVFETASWTGLVYPMEQYYPTWSLPEGHPAVTIGDEAFTSLFGRRPEISHWTFSTNGVAINGLHGVPCIGFGPGQEELAHSRDEYVPVSDVVQACAFYAALANRFARAERITPDKRAKPAGDSPSSP